MKSRKSNAIANQQQVERYSANKGFFLSSELLKNLPEEPSRMTAEDFLRHISGAIRETIQTSSQLEGRKTTPGPWKLKDNGVLYAGGKVIGTFHNAQPTRRAGMDNRNLVVHSPLLLDFCQKVADTFQGADDPLGKEARVLVEKCLP